MKLLYFIPPDAEDVHRPLAPGAKYQRQPRKKAGVRNLEGRDDTEERLRLGEIGVRGIDPGVNTALTLSAYGDGPVMLPDGTVAVQKKTYALSTAQYLSLTRQGERLQAQDRHMKQQSGYLHKHVSGIPPAKDGSVECIEQQLMYIDPRHTETLAALSVHKHFRLDYGIARERTLDVIADKVSGRGGRKADRMFPHPWDNGQCVEVFVGYGTASVHSGSRISRIGAFPFKAFWPKLAARCTLILSTNTQLVSCARCAVQLMLGW